MRILEESEVTYSIEDILDSIKEELGFKFQYNELTKVATFKIDTYEMNISFDSEIDLWLKTPSAIIKDEDFELSLSIIESMTQVLGIIKRMTKE